MYRTPVSSSNISSIGYDQQTGTLEVEFHSGDIYQYFNVSDYLYNGLMNAASKGQFLNEHIRHSYRYQKTR
jgi:hypothetical protein